MNILYNIGIWAIQPGIWVASLFSRKVKLFYKGRKGLVKKIEEAFKDVKDEVVWFHC